MQITRQADYAVRAITYLAQLEPGLRVSTAEVAREQHIPLTFLAKIISQLSNTGLIHATRGARGGITLAHAPGEISLLAVVEAIDGLIVLNACVLAANTCPVSDGCAVRDVWCEAQAELVTRLRQSTFGPLAHTPPAEIG
ncbi:MAG: RrF2 family transcriptional regulator, partial [Anaerolineales bacterium]